MESARKPSRRKFIGVAAASASVILGRRGGAQTAPAVASGPATTRAARGRGGPAPLPALGNGEGPAVVFQAWPEGTGAYLEKVVREKGVAAFERVSMKVEAWEGEAPASEEEVAFLPVHRLAALIGAGKLLPSELTRIYLERLKRFDPVLLCAVTIMEGQAKEAAQAADLEMKAGKYRGPLHGIPWGVKDLFAVKGTVTTWGAGEFRERVIDETAEVVMRLEAAGAILIAKLATGRFALGDQWYRGRTNNPWNVKAGSSGSSAGPASATAAGCVGFGIGTETRGSIVSPASVCGISALRPTYGRVSRHGGMVLAWTMDRVGPLCRTVEDCALVFNAIHGVDGKDGATVTGPFEFRRDLDLSKVRIGFDRSAPPAFVDKLRELGADVKAMPARPRMLAGMASLEPESAAAFEGDLASGVLQDVDTPNGGKGTGRFTQGRSVSAVDFLKVQRHREILVRKMAELMGDFDVYVCQTDLGDCSLCSMTGHPAVVLPWGFAGVGGRPEQPQCTVMVGRLFGDDVLLSVAHAYQKGADWHRRRPKLEV